MKAQWKLSFFDYESSQKFDKFWGYEYNSISESKILYY